VLLSQTWSVVGPRVPVVDQLARGSGAPPRVEGGSARRGVGAQAEGAADPEPVLVPEDRVSFLDHKTRVSRVTCHTHTRKQDGGAYGRSGPSLS